MHAVHIGVEYLVIDEWATTTLQLALVACLLTTCPRQVRAGLFSYPPVESATAALWLGVDCMVNRPSLGRPARETALGKKSRMELCVQWLPAV